MARMQAYGVLMLAAVVGAVPILAAENARETKDLLALYTFERSKDNVIRDRS
jgi:hypothetical protein